ncbi:unnamed protein product [Mytilus edulis]|uniref:Uncharacterized protein n=1 Tax=Mytilus edulis TaxID=6550 RepID=A0A8S3TC17_MYTED|nr:unnamed protein product [Mytilus edulis]
MDKLRAPEKFNVEARNLADAWKRWKEEVELYIDLTMDSEDEKAKVKMFLYLVGNQGREVYETLTFEHPPNDRTFIQITAVSIVEENMNILDPAVQRIVKRVENGKTNHFESVCQSGKITKTRRPHQVRTLSDDHASEDYDSDEFFEIKAVTLVPINTVDGKNSRHVYATMNIVGNKIMPVRFQLDSGATCNIINSNALKELGIKELKKTSQVLKMYNNTTIKPLGTCQLKLINPEE